MAVKSEEGVSGMKTILALLYSKGTHRDYESIRGRTRLEKLLFLLQKEGFPIRDYEFEAYDYGPCAMRLYDDLEVLEAYNLIKMKPWKYEDVIETLESEFHEEPSLDRKVEIFTLTKKGKEKGKKAFDFLKPEQQKKIVEIKKQFNSMPLMELLRYIYNKYPNYAKKSKIRDAIFGSSMFGTMKDLPSFVREDES